MKGLKAILEQDAEFEITGMALIRLVANGYSNKEIAAMLYLAEGTVKNGLSKILEKLHLKDRTPLAIYALKNGLDN